MTQKLEVYKCEVCGNIVEMLHGGKGELVCCGKPMSLFTENTVDASKEKHLPVVEKTKHFVTVKVGSVPHPMEEKHFIEWVELIDGDHAWMTFLNPGQAPEATFELQATGKKIVVREFCNLHGLWKTESE